MNRWPDLPLADWQNSKDALHLFLQIVGKIRLACAAPVNHWWHVTFHQNARGLTTRPMSYQGRQFEIEFDLLQHRLTVTTDAVAMASFGYIGLSVADFYAQLGDALRGLGIEIAIRPVPYDTFTTIPFADDRQHIADNSEYMQRFGRVLCAVWPVFEIFRGRYYGKSSPVHLFWHSFDIAVTRFSGRPAALEKGNAVAREAYSHEAISFGFWPGDTNFPEAAFYSYTYPDPPDIGMQRLSTDQAFWDDSRGSHLALLKYSEVRSSRDPAAMLLEFFESAYLAGTRAAGWDTIL